MATTALNVAPPAIAEHDLLAFHHSHFGTTAASHFTATFLEPVHDATSVLNQNDGLAGEQEEDLGYYSDGVKRTLTDEQVAMFRHSEIQSLLRECRHAAEARSFNPSRSTSTSTPDTASYGDEAQEQAEEPEKHGRKRNRKKKHQRKREVKPDLRKRTWDIVDEGVGTLSYEDADSVPTSGRGAGPQRKRISYDDM